MSKKIRSAGLSLFVAGSLFLSACNSPTPAPAETLDAGTVLTRAVETVQAGVQQTQDAKPPATATSEVTPTFDPTIGAALTAVANFTATAQAAALQQTTPQTSANTPAAQTTPVSQTTPVAQTTPVVQATSSGGGAAATSGDKAELVSQSPEDGTKITKEASWDMKLVVKNTGTTTWTSQYSLKFFAGDPMGSPKDLFVVGEVKPGEMYTFLFSMKAPSTIGDKQTNWVIQNADGKNFYSMFVKIEVTQ